MVTVGVVPVVAGRHRAALLSLLVALAVGTLLGDALMHLLPHALHTPHHDPAPVWRGFLATALIIALSTVDQLMGLSGAGHSHGPAKQGEEMESFTYMVGGKMVEGEDEEERTSLPLEEEPPLISPPLSPPPPYTSQFLSTSSEEQVRGPLDSCRWRREATATPSPPPTPPCPPPPVW